MMCVECKAPGPRLDGCDCLFANDDPPTCPLTFSDRSECGKPWGECEHCTVCAQQVIARIKVTRKADGVSWKEAACAECLPAIREDYSGPDSDVTIAVTML